jgi:hypothetical protein
MRSYERRNNSTVAIMNIQYKEGGKDVLCILNVARRCASRRITKEM